MDIKGLSADMTPESLPGAEAVSKVKQKRLDSEPARVSDRADMSKLSELMSRSAKMLKQETAPRSEKIKAFQQRVDDPIDLSNNVVDTIMRRMVGG